MLETVTASLQQVSGQPLGLLFALVLGTVSAVACGGCALPAIGLLAGYSGTQTCGSRKETLRSTLSFTLGTLLALMVLGGISGFVGQVAQNTLGRYWRVVAGSLAVFLGLASLRLLPFELSFVNSSSARYRFRRLGPVLAGLVLGGIVAACSLPCNPGIFIVVGAAALQGTIAWAILLIGMFAIGFSIPIGAVMLGISAGTSSLAARGADILFRRIAGLILILGGFYFLLTF